MDINYPQTFNRYAYVGNNPLGYTDPSGLLTCGNCSPPGGGGGGILDGIITLGISALIGELEEIFSHPTFHGSTSPRPNAQPWDEYHIHYGPNIAGALGLPSSGCEFGMCGDITNGFQAGAATAPGSWCLQHPKMCTAGIELADVLEKVPPIAASVLLLNMKGDGTADPNRCIKVRQQATAECSALLNTSSYPPGVKRPRRIPTGTDNSGAFFACVRQKMVEAGCPNY